MLEGLQTYMTPEDAVQASIDQTDKALGGVVALLYALYLEKRNLGLELSRTDDEDEIGEIEWRMKMLKAEESSLHRIESGLQSRLKAGQP